MRKYDFAIVTGLKKSPNFNDKLCQLVKYLPNKKRWQVELLSGKFLAIKEENLKLISGKEIYEHFTELHEIEMYNISSDLEGMQDQFESKDDVDCWIKETINSQPENMLCLLNYHDFETPHTQAILDYALDNRGIYKGKLIEETNLNLFYKNQILCVTIREEDRPNVTIKRVYCSFKRFCEATFDHECAICFENCKKYDPIPTTCGKKIQFFCCNHCLKHVCTICYPQMSSQLCPICRTGRVVSNNGLAPLNEIKSLRNRRFFHRFQ